MISRFPSPSRSPIAAPADPKFQNFQSGGRGPPPTAAVPQIDVGPVGLISAGDGSVDHKIGMAVLVDVTDGERLKLPRGL